MVVGFNHRHEHAIARFFEISKDLAALKKGNFGKEISALLLLSIGAPRLGTLNTNNG